MENITSIIRNKITLLVIIIGASFVNCSYAQMPHIFKAYTLPKYPSSSDSVLIIDSILLSTGGDFRVDRKILLNGNSIEIDYCYKDSVGFDLLTTRLDTAIVVNLPNGLYHCSIFTKIFNSGDPGCDFIPYGDSIKFTFTVGHTSAINEIESEQISFSPNPSTNTLHLQTSLPHFTTQILDLSGRTISTNTNSKELDISILPSGIYLLRLQHEQGNVVRRFVKE